jgi:hypothetical protein
VTKVVPNSTYCPDPHPARLERRILVNKKNVLKLAKAIQDAAKAGSKKPEMGFSMNFIFSDERRGSYDMTGHSCQTVGCIAGWATHVLGKRTPAEMSKMFRFEIEDEAQKQLGLTARQAQKLFYPNSQTVEYGSDAYKGIPVSAAVGVLRKMAKTGRIVWGNIRKYATLPE